MGFDAEEALRAGDPARALVQLQAMIREHPDDAKLRVFLFQLLCVLGQWERAATQLELCAQMDAAALPMREMYRDAIACERVREDVFAGTRSPMLFGEPGVWIALLIESLLRAGQGDAEAAERQRQDAFAQAPASSGTINGEAFAWIADADMRLGPVLEAVVNGRYYWIPFPRLARIDIEAPSDLRDAVWIPAHLGFVNGGEALALIPSRYPGSHSAAEGLLALARKTAWNEVAEGVFHGCGQRVFATDSADYPLFDIRQIVFTATDAAEPPAEHHG